MDKRIVLSRVRDTRLDDNAFHVTRSVFSDGRRCYRVYYAAHYSQIKVQLSNSHPSVKWENYCFWFNDPEDEVTFLMAAT